METITISQSLVISGFSMLVVFFVLLIISYLVDITAIFTKKKINRKEG